MFQAGSEFPSTETNMQTPHRKPPPPGLQGTGTHNLLAVRWNKHFCSLRLGTADYFRDHTETWCVICSPGFGDDSAMTQQIYRQIACKSGSEQQLFPEQRSSLQTHLSRKQKFLLHLRKCASRRSRRASQKQRGCKQQQPDWRRRPAVWLSEKRSFAFPCRPTEAASSRSC